MAVDVRSVSDDGQACTIYLPVIAYRQVWETVRDSGLPFALDGAISEWSTLTVLDEESTLTMTPLRRVAPGDKLSKLILGTINFFERISGAPSDRQQLIASTVVNCQMTIGVRGRPMFTDAHMDLVFEVARVCNGLIFNGSGMIDATGRMILNSDGSFDP